MKKSIANVSSVTSSPYGPRKFLISLFCMCLIFTGSAYAEQYYKKEGPPNQFATSDSLTTQETKKNQFAQGPSAPDIQFCSTKGSGHTNFNCQPVQTLSSNFSYFSVTEFNSLMSSSGCKVTNVGGIYSCRSGSDFSTSWGGSSIWWLTADSNDYVAQVFIFIYN